MHRVVSTVIAVAALAAGGLAVAEPAVADTAPQRPSAEAPATPGSYTGLTPARLLDTRKTAPVAAHGTYVLTVAGAGGVPTSGAGSVVLNVTAVSPQSEGYLTVWPDGAKPVVSNVNFVSGQTVADLVTVPVGTDGKIRIFNGSAGTTNVLVDVSGWFRDADIPSAQGAFAPVDPPARLLDTRKTTAVPALGSRKLQVTGATVPAAAGAVALTVTAVTPAASGYLTLYPGATRPTTSAVNFGPGRTVATAADVRLGDDGSVTVFNGSARPVQVVVDVAGWFRGTTGGQASTFSFLPPARILDTRNGTGGNAHTGVVASGTTVRQAVGGAGGVPVKGVGAVVLTVTVTAATGSGYLTVYPNGNRPTASTLNFVSGQTVTNLVVVPVAFVDDQIEISYYNGSSGGVQLVADVNGFVRYTDVTPPTSSTSRYVNDIPSSASTSQITSLMHGHGCDDATDIQDSDPRFTLLEFGAQTNKAGSGGGDRGVFPPNSAGRLTYPQVTAAVEGYLDGFAACRGESASGPVTVGVGTSSDGFEGATYTPADKGTDWADLVGGLVSYGSDHDVTVVGADDIEPDFDATVTEVGTWVKAFLAGNTLQLVNNGAASACPAVLGQVNRTCGLASGQTVPWKQSDYVSLSYGLGPTRISVLPQVYVSDQAVQWENISLTAGGHLRFAGVLTEVGACGNQCTSFTPAVAWTAMRQALDANDATARTTLPAASDIDYDG